MSDEPMVGNFNVRVPLAYVNWLHDRAVEDGVTISEVIRNAVAVAMVKAGDAERYGIELPEDEES